MRSLSFCSKSMMTLLVSYLMSLPGLLLAADWRETSTLPAPEAIQAAAADERFVYAIASRSVARYSRQSGQRVAVSSGPATHLNSGFLWNGRLLCAHSNYPKTPEQSDIRILDPESMELSVFHDFGNYGGSLTWVVRYQNHWWCNFALYGDRNHQTFLVKFDDEWKELRRWSYPDSVVERLGRYSLSGGLWFGNDLLVSGHNRPEVYRLRLPEDGTTLMHTGTESTPFTGQGFAVDAVTTDLVGISRAERRVIFASASAKKEARVGMPKRGICAHRGVSDTHPENTLAAFHEAIRLGVQMIEFDVVLSKDQHLVLMHDATLNRTTDGSGPVAEHTLAQLKQLDAGSWKDPRFAGERIPTLDEALAVMPQNIWLNVHLKGSVRLAEKTTRAIVKHKRLHQAFLACDAPSVVAARLVESDIRICNMERQANTQQYVDETIRMQADFIQLLRGRVDPRHTRQLVSAGIRINYCCSNDAEQVDQLFRAGVEFPLVDRVSAMLKVADQHSIPRLKANFQTSAAIVPTQETPADALSRAIDSNGPQTSPTPD